MYHAYTIGCGSKGIKDMQTEPEMFSLLSIKYGLTLECAGMTRRGTSCYKRAKDILGIKGRPQKRKVLEQFTIYVDERKKEYEEG